MLDLKDFFAIYIVAIVLKISLWIKKPPTQKKLRRGEGKTKNSSGKTGGVFTI